MGVEIVLSTRYKVSVEIVLPTRYRVGVEIVTPPRYRSTISTMTFVIVSLTKSHGLPVVLDLMHHIDRDRGSS